MPYPMDIGFGGDYAPGLPKKETNVCTRVHHHREVRRALTERFSTASTHTRLLLLPTNKSVRGADGVLLHALDVCVLLDARHLQAHKRHAAIPRARGAIRELGACRVAREARAMIAALELLKVATKVRLCAQRARGKEISEDVYVLAVAPSNAQRVVERTGRHRHELRLLALSMRCEVKGVHRYIHEPLSKTNARDHARGSPHER